MDFRRHIVSGLLLLLALLPAAARPDTAPPSPQPQPQLETRAQVRAAIILVVGDSLSAEYGLARDSGWVKLLGDRVAREANQYSVVNASISGDTTSGGRMRLPALLRQHRPAVVVIALGANDGLRGLDIGAMRANLQAMIDSCRAQDARVVLVGMQLPPNYGAAYGERFFSVYRALGESNHVARVPFLLAGFAERLDLFQADRLHPREQAQPRMLENVWPHLRPLLAGR
jgi:acyl-CoA thioesterase-1